MPTMYIKVAKCFPVYNTISKLLKFKIFLGPTLGMCTLCRNKFGIIGGEKNQE